jgi:2',3'-cyclic-nucleotide 2'-phosphodiesterase (5'-nucleotidase family)
LQAGSDAVVWFNSGDFFQGTLWYTRFKWKLVAKVRNTMAYRKNSDAQMNNMLDLDAMTLGNHEFDDGADGLRPFLKSLNCSMVVSNMKTK